jgi:hypothetical protein
MENRIDKSPENIPSYIYKIFDIKSIKKEDTSIFSTKEINHSKLIESFEFWLNSFKNYINHSYTVNNIHNIQDEGVDIIIEFEYFSLRIGIQIKSYRDIEDESFSRNTFAQIQSPHSHKLNLLVLVLCGDLNNKSQEGKMKALMSKISQQHTKDVIIIESRMAATVYNTYIKKTSPLLNLNSEWKETISNLDLNQPTEINNVIIDSPSNPTYNILKNPSDLEIDQYIREIELSNNEDKGKIFNELEIIARSKRLYKDKKILSICDKYILENDDSYLLSRVLDFIKRLLDSSINYDKAEDFRNYIKSKYSQKFQNIILSVDTESGKPKFYVKQILEWYNLFDPIELRELYWKALKKSIKTSTLEINEFLHYVAPFFNKINENEEFKFKCRSELFKMTKSTNKRLSERSKALMNFFSKNS